jgi:protein SCO1/2
MTSADTGQRGRRRRLWLWVAIPAGLLLAFAMFSMFRPHIYAGVVLQSSDPAPSMDGLVYDTGEPVELSDLDDQVVLVYFGYTYCPDLCPTMLGTISRALDDIDEDVERVTAMMVTVDPSRDTPEVLADYVGHFGDHIRGVWGTESDVRSVASGYGVTFSYDEPDEEGNYLVSHTGSLFAIDPGGALRVVYPVELTSDALAADLQDMLG